MVARIKVALDPTDRFDLNWGARQAFKCRDPSGCAVLRGGHAARILGDCVEKPTDKMRCGGRLSRLKLGHGGGSENRTGG